MNRKTNDISAFPCKDENYVEGLKVNTYEQGMTLRDYFAAKAMQAMISNSDLKNGPAVDGVSVTIEIAAYLVADAMIKERNK